MRVRSVAGVLLAAALVVPATAAHAAVPHGSNGDTVSSQREVQRAAKGMHVRVITYNIRFGQFGLANLANDIRKTGADVAVLQEVDNRTPTKGPHHAKNLAKRLGWHYAYDRNSRKSFGWRGNAILSKYPIAFTNRYDVPHPAGTEKRGLMRAQLKLSARKRMNVWVTHLNPGAGKIKQARSVRYRIGKPTCATVLGGDMNSGPGSAEHRHLSANLTDLWKAVGTGNGATNKRRTARIDYLFTRRVTRVSSWVAPLRHSDHRAVIGNIRVTNANSC